MKYIVHSFLDQNTFIKLPLPLDFNIQYSDYCKYCGKTIKKIVFGI